MQSDQAQKKRLLFAEEIRSRQRTSIKVNIKLSFQHSQLLKQLMENPSANIKDLSLLITNQKQYEMEVAERLLAWLPSHDIALHSREQAFYWTSVLAAIVDNHPSTTSFVLAKSFQQLLCICDQINDHDLVCILLTTALTACKK